MAQLKRIEPYYGCENLILANGGTLLRLQGNTVLRLQISEVKCRDYSERKYDSY